jgi:pimeloyl-ACP methyl ester carboxylesterase
MEQVVSKDGTVIRYWTSGEGPHLLLVHGAAADHKRWAAISPRFEQHFSVHAMDRRGRGGSEDALDYDIQREAEDVAAVVGALGEQVSVLGHSYGAMCCLEAALLTRRIRRLVLYEPPVPTGTPSIPPGLPDRIKGLVDGGQPDAALELFLVEIVKMPEQELATFRQSPLWRARVAVAPTIFRELTLDRTYRLDSERFANLQVPALLLLGGDSPPSVRQGTDLLAEALPDSRVAILPGQRHIAMDTGPDLFAREVLRFLLEPGSRQDQA